MLRFDLNFFIEIGSILYQVYLGILPNILKMLYGAQTWHKAMYFPPTHANLSASHARSCSKTQI